jgi:YD repeat-containing protein
MNFVIRVVALATLSTVLAAHAGEDLPTLPPQYPEVTGHVPQEFLHMTGTGVKYLFNISEYRGIDIGEPRRPAEKNKEEPKDDTNKPQDCGGAGGAGTSSPLSGNPVVLSTGEKFEAELDFESPKIYGLGLGRTYRSKSTRSGIFGKKWLSEYDFTRVTYSTCQRDPDNPAICVPSTAVVGLPDGSQYTFYGVGFASGLLQTADSALTLVWNGWDVTPSWTLGTDNVAYSFDKNGYVISVAREGVASVNFLYTGTTLTGISSPAGDSLGFTYTNGLVTQVRDANGANWAFTYTPAGMLQSVSSPGPQGHSRTYHYEDPADATRLTGISVDGVRYSTYAYLANGQVKSSSHTNDV